MKNHFKIQSKVWLYPGMAGWHFVSIPPIESDQIKKAFSAMKRGWGSLPVIVKIGKTSWSTSIFPDTKAGAYLLPLKADIRKKEKIISDDIITFTIEIKV